MEDVGAGDQGAMPIDIGGGNRPAMIDIDEDAVDRDSEPVNNNAAAVQQPKRSTMSEMISKKFNG